MLSDYCSVYFNIVVVIVIGKELFLISQGMRRSFLDYDAFIGLDYTTKHVEIFSAEMINAIPLHEKPLTANDTQYMCCQAYYHTIIA